MLSSTPRIQPATVKAQLSSSQRAMIPRENEPYELASHPMVLGVAAASARDYREGYSNFGDDVDLSAPAGAVTEDMLGAKGYSSGDFTYSFGGISAAGPVVAGVACGAHFEVNPELTRGQVYEVLTSSTDKIGNQPYVDGFNKYYGFGRANAYSRVANNSRWRNLSARR